MNSTSSPNLSVSSTSSRRASSGSSVSSVSLDFEKPSTSQGGDPKEPVLFGDPPWGDRSSSECMLEIIANPTSPTISYPSPSNDSIKESLLNAEFVLDAKEIQREEETKANKKESAFESVKTKLSEAENIDTKTMRKRSDSMTSTDSISPELNHFRPIDVSPRTSHRKLANGRRESPKIVHTTPRNLTNLAQDESSGDVSLPPLVKAKFESLIKEKKKKLGDSSKGTMTGTAGAGSTSNLMRQELNRRLHRKPSGSRHTLLSPAAQRQLAKPEKSPLADERSKVSKNDKQDSEESPPAKEENNFDVKGLTQHAKNTGGDLDCDDKSLPSSDLENESRLQGGASVNGRTCMNESQAQGSEKNAGEKRKSCSPQMQRKKHRLDSETSPQSVKEARSSGDSDNSPVQKKSPGKVYRMKMNQPKPKQKTVKNLLCSKDSAVEQDHSVSPKRRKLPSRSEPSPPLPSLVPSPQCDELKSDTKKEISCSCKNTSENCQENISRFETDRNKLGIITPDKGILMDTKQGSNREQNGNIVKSVAAKSPKSKTSNSPEEIRKTATYSTSKVKAKMKNSSLPSSNDHERAPSPNHPLKTPSKTRRNTIWKYMELVSEEERRIKQEEADRKLAMKLQEEFDKQDRRQMAIVDRSQGADAAYELRDRFRTSAKTKIVVDVDSDDDMFG